MSGWTVFVCLWRDLRAAMGLFGSLHFHGNRSDGRRRRSRPALSHAPEELEDRRLPAVVLSPQEQLLIELVNRARANPAAEAARFGISLNQALDPGTISPDPKQPLAPNEILAEAGGLHAQDMLDHNFFDHVNKQGQNPSDRAKALGYSTGAGENIAWYGNPSGVNRISEVYARHEALFLSKG